MQHAILECKTLVEGSRAIVKSPIIGRAFLSVTMGDVLSFGQIFGEIRRLNKCFNLKLPESVGGTIVFVKGRDRMIPLACGEVLLELEEAVGQTLKDSRPTASLLKPSASIDAPMDGMFYLAPSPQDPPYVKIGDTIAPGQTIGLIEVMKCFYPLKYQGAERVKVADIKVKSASPVSLGAQILILEKSE